MLGAIPCNTVFATRRSGKHIYVTHARLTGLPTPQVTQLTCTHAYMHTCILQLELESIEVKGLNIDG